MDFANLGQTPAANVALPGGHPAPAGWYADPAGTARLVRYWDGARWTDHTAAR
jgi:hypothetical protein